MKILIKQFLGKNHSWSVCGWGIARALKKLNHEVHLFSTDGIDHFPLDLKENLIGYCNSNSFTLISGRDADKNYDMQISYTAPRNFPFYLSNGSKNRFGIWTYEWNGKNVLPSGFAKNHQHCDAILAPSNFSKDIFINSGVPENKIKVIPHGIDKTQYVGTSTIQLNTNKKFKILANIAQNHKRKNIPGLLEVYGKAFTKNDDVCLILKGKSKKVENTFDVSLDDCIKNFKKQFPNHAEYKIYTEFIDDISSLYRSVDAVFTMSHGEGFFFPGLEAAASKKITIAPNYGGQLDFLNLNNSLLISGTEERADPKSMYWEQKNNAVWFRPDIDDAVDKLRHAYENFEDFNSNIDNKSIIENYKWDNIVQQMLKLT